VTAAVWRRQVAGFKSLPERAGAFARLFRRRLRDRRFWVVQGLVLVITGAHHFVESSRLFGRHEALAFVPVSFYLVPVLYAALHFGMEGALPTALWSAALALPNAFLWHGPTDRLGEFFQIVIVVAVAVLVAQRVEGEVRSRQNTEQMSRRLMILNATAAAASCSLEPARIVADVLEVLLRENWTGAVWLALADDPDLPALTTRTRDGGSSAELAAVARQAAEEGRPRLIQDWTDDLPSRHLWSAAAVPVRVGEQVSGALGIFSHCGPLSAEDVGLLETVARQLGVALDNCRHYQAARKALADLLVAQDNLRAYLRMVVRAQEEERRRIARELHDDTIQSLVVVKATLDKVVASRGLPARVRGELDSLRGFVEGTVRDLRRFCQDLRPSLLDDLGLVQAVDWCLADLERRTGIATRLQVAGEPRRLNPDIEVAVYRIAQEALRNVEKHARATLVEVALSFGPDCLRVEVADNGCGFVAAAILGRADAGPTTAGGSDCSGCRNGPGWSAAPSASKANPAGEPPCG
jgi:signal transduction histidine kinase